ncbi:hypothetical protein YC2023_002042 [Brassica napus]
MINRLRVLANRESSARSNAMKLEEKVSALDEREADVTANSKLKEVKQKHISNQPVPVKIDLYLCCKTSTTKSGFMQTDCRSSCHVVMVRLLNNRKCQIFFKIPKHFGYPSHRISRWLKIESTGMLPNTQIFDLQDFASPLASALQSRGMKKKQHKRNRDMEEDNRSSLSARTPVRQMLM